MKTRELFMFHVQFERIEETFNSYIIYIYTLEIEYTYIRGYLYTNAHSRKSHNREKPQKKKKQKSKLFMINAEHKITESFVSIGSLFLLCFNFSPLNTTKTLGFALKKKLKTKNV